MPAPQACDEHVKALLPKVLITHQNFGVRNKNFVSTPSLAKANDCCIHTPPKLCSSLQIVDMMELHLWKLDWAYRHRELAVSKIAPKAGLN